ncbi:hypothetical protein SRB17_19810 [Streptomyces sp. RB17]|uniref:SMI1/KNR4 family protein n=1 Tax=Streptomyces sp. RB17 TaxID=2585197 RepID=UPI00130CBA97|nr:SMI1/KNR4 family protein [Streptomyces sp. RB17]MQY34015.1 hypothetical protein [Streptomyces sp. RB17]
MTAVAHCRGRWVTGSAGSVLFVRRSVTLVETRTPARADGAVGRPRISPLSSRESNGIEGEYGDGLVWSAERIASENQSLREDAELATLYMPFDPLLFFADAGNGDLFALLPRIDRPDVFVWNHEDDSRT